MKGYSSGIIISEHVTNSGPRHGLVLTIALMIVSSPIVMLANPASAASPYSTDGSTLVPSILSQDGSDFTTQAALSSLTARQTNNIVNTLAYYDIIFKTATTGTIKKIEVTFPTTIFATYGLFVEAEGIGPGKVTKAGTQTLVYTVDNAVSIPAGTEIRLEFSRIANPPNPGLGYQVTVTTRNAANAIIDGPTKSIAYNIID